MVHHKTTLRNHRGKVDYTAELPSPKASQPEDRIRDKPSWNTELDTEPIPGILPQGLAQVLLGMQDISSSLKPLCFISTGHRMQSRCLPNLYCSTGMGSWHLPPSAFTRQPPKVKAISAKHIFEIHPCSAHKVSVKRSISFFCSLVPPCLAPHFFLQGLTRSWPTSPTVQLQGPGTHLIPFCPWIPMYDIRKPYMPTSVGSSTHAALLREKAEGSIIKPWLGGSQIIPT